MKNRAVIISTVLCLLPILLSILLYKQLPEQIAVHFSNNGDPDNYLPKPIAAFGLPLLLAAVNLYTQFRIANDPKAKNSATSMRSLITWLIPVLSLIIVPITLFMAVGRQLPIVMIVTAIAGMIIMICGNYLPKCKRNYTLGIKLPWTLDNEDNWNHTHRISGFIWVIGGIVIAANAFLQIPYLIVAAIVCIVLIPFIYSYLFYRRQKKITQHS